MSRAATLPASCADDQFRLAIAGPILTQPLAELLEGAADRLPAGVGGASSVVWQLVGDLVSRGRRVSVVTLDESVSTPVTAGGPLLDLTYGPYRPRHRMRDLMRVERHAVRDGVLRVRPALVHAHWCCEYALGAFAGGIPTLVTVHDWVPMILRLTEARDRPHWWGRALLYFTTLARARHLTAVSPYTAQKVRHFTRAAVEVVPNGVADAAFAPEAKGPGRRASGGRPVIISVNSGFGPRKNVHRLLEACSSLRQRGIDCELHLVGDGYEPAGPCEAWARQRRLAEGVTFVGPCDRAEVLRRMGAAMLLAHPSREESFGMTLIEAMSQRVPVIGGARAGAVPWVLGGGRAGLLTDAEDPRALARAMEAVLTQETLRKRLAVDGYARAWRDFRQSQVTDLYLRAYRRVLAEEARR
jgi:glycosyltransferase involved in cell wall biosynthesis